MKAARVAARPLEGRPARPRSEASTVGCKRAYKVSRLPKTGRGLLRQRLSLVWFPSLDTKEVPMLTRTVRQWSRRILEAVSLEIRRNGLRARPSLEALEVRTLPSTNPVIGDVFYIEMENHNLTQPSTVTSPQQLLGNPAAPYLNSLMTPGDPNAAQTSYASNYYNVEYNNPSVSIHPSEPNYVWQEAG